MGSEANAVHREPWNKGKIVGQKASFKLKGQVGRRSLRNWCCRRLRSPLHPPKERPPQLPQFRCGSAP